MWPIQLCHHPWPWSTWRLFQLFFSENMCSLLFQCLIKSRQSNKVWHYWWPWATFEGHFTYCKQFRCVCVRHTAYTICTKSIALVRHHMWSVPSMAMFIRKDWCMMLSATCSHVISSFNGHVHSQGLVYDAKRHLFTCDQFLQWSCSFARTGVWC